MKVSLSKDEALELANWLDGTDAHMSIGDRLLLAGRIRRKVAHEQSENEGNETHQS